MENSEAVLFLVNQGGFTITNDMNNKTMQLNMNGYIEVQKGDETARRFKNDDAAIAYFFKASD
jgi:hypothetical protein